MADVKQGGMKPANQARKKDTPWRNDYFLSNALRDIMAQNPEIKPEDICFAASVYYPIADIDLRFEERTFEDFDSIEHDMLQFVAELGTDVDLLARTTGLSPSYVHKFLRVLEGYGHIDETGQVTETGRESLAEGKKIVCKHVAQKVQMDALSLHLLKVEELIREEDLYDRAHTEYKVGIIPCLDGVSRQNVADQLESADLMQLVAQDKGVLNANVESIQSIACAGLRFVKCVMLARKKGSSDSEFDPTMPMVFGKRLVSEKGKYRMTSVWKLFDISNRQTARIQDFFHKILGEQQSASKKDWVDQRLVDCNGKKKTREQYERRLHSVFDLSKARVTLVPREAAYIGMTVEITEKSIVQYHRELIDWLVSIGRRGGAVLSSDFWYGGVLRITTTDARVTKLAERLVECIASKGFRFMQDYWVQEFAPHPKRAREESHNEPEEESKGSICERMMASLDEVRLDRYDRAMNA